MTLAEMGLPKHAAPAESTSVAVLPDRGPTNGMVPRHGQFTVKDTVDPDSVAVVGQFSAAGQKKVEAKTVVV